MKKLVLLFIISCFGITSYAQESAIFDPKSVTLPIYAGLEGIQAAIPNPKMGMIVYNNTTQSNWIFNGIAWANSKTESQWANNNQDIYYLKNSNVIGSFSNSTNYAIPEMNNQGAVSPINVTFPGVITDPSKVTISMNLSHPNCSDLSVELVSPNGTIFYLINRLGYVSNVTQGWSSDFNAANTISFNSQASYHISDTDPISAGTYLPTGVYVTSLDLLLNENVSGVWKLIVRDNNFVGDNLGQLISWGINFENYAIGTGKVGINTPNPSDELHVVGKTRTNLFRMTNGAGIGKTLISDEKGNASWQNQWGSDGYSLTSMFRWVGIGLTTPHAPLHIYNGYSKKTIVLAESANNDHQFTGLGNDYGIFRHQTFDVSVDHAFFAGVNSTSSNELLRIKGNGKVGIGTSNPQALLDVNGEIKSLSLNSAEVTTSTVNTSTVITSKVAFPNVLNSKKIVLWDNNPSNIDEFYGFGIYSGILRYQVANTISDHVFYAGKNIVSSNELFRVKGNGNATLVGTLTQSSDLRLKHTIKPLSQSIQKIQQINGYSYFWNDKNKDQTLQIGLIAQEVEKLYPELVKEDANGYKSVNYVGLVPVLLEAIKEQQNQIDELNRQFKVFLKQSDAFKITAESKR